MNENQIAKLDDIAKQGTIALSIANQFEKTFAVANCVQQLKTALTPEVMKPITQLQGTKLGFRTDKIYDEKVVRDCLIEATILGLYPVGNQFNIIAGNMYITKEGFLFLLKNLKGLSYSCTPGVPKSQTGGAVVDVELEWTYRGKTEKKTLSLAIRVNVGMGSDAINGKATRKALAWLYNNITGQAVGEGDVTDLDVMKPVGPKLAKLDETKNMSQPKPTFLNAEEITEEEELKM